MGVFDNSTKVGRRVEDPKTDKRLPGLGMLQAGGMTSPGGFGGVNGVDAAVIHSNQEHRVEGNRTHMVLQNRTHTTIGNNACTTIGNRTAMTIANVTATTVGNTVATNIGNTAETMIAPHVLTHAAPQNRFEPTAYMSFVLNWIKMHSSLNNIGVIYFQFYASYISITPTYVDIKPIMNFGFCSINIHFELFDNGSRALENRLAAMQGDIDGLDGEMKLLELGTQIAIKSLSLAINSYAL